MKIFLVVLLGVAVHASHAQNVPSDVVAYSSLTRTPMGLFAPMAPPPTGARHTEAGLALRYGSLPRGEGNNESRAYAVSALFHAGSRAVLSLTGGAYKETCPDPECKNILMAGAGGQVDLAPAFMRQLTAFSMALSADLGWSAKQFGTTYLTAHAGVPLSLMLGGDPKSLRMSMWATPGFGYGRATISGNFPRSSVYTGSASTIAGGVALFTPSPRLSVQFGAMHVATSAAKTSVGVNVVLNP